MPVTTGIEPFGEAFRQVLPNGLALIFRRVKRLPMVRLRAAVRAGGVEDGVDCAGLAAFTLALLSTGTHSRDEEASAAGFADLGAELHLEPGRDWIEAGTRVLSVDLDPALRLLADVLLRPALAEEKAGRVLSELRAERQGNLAEPPYRLEQAFHRAIYPDHPYGCPLRGDDVSLSRLTRDHAVALHQACYRPERAVLVGVGDIEPGRFFAAAAEVFSDWAAAASVLGVPAGPDVQDHLSAEGENVGASRAGGALTGGALHAAQPSGQETTAVPVVYFDAQPDLTQANLRLGCPAIGRAHSDWDLLSVANYVLGGAGLASRICDRVRTRHGLAYTAGSRIVPQRLAGPFFAHAQTKNASFRLAVDLIREEISRLTREQIGAEELETARRQYAGALLFRAETAAGIASALIEAELYKLGPDHQQRQLETVRVAAAEEVLAAAARHLQLPRMSLVVVGEPDALAGQLNELGEVTGIRP